VISGYVVVIVEGLEVKPVCAEVIWDKQTADKMAGSVCRSKFGQVIKVCIGGVPPGIAERLLNTLGVNRRK